MLNSCTSYEVPAQRRNDDQIDVVVVVIVVVAIVIAIGATVIAVIAIAIITDIAIRTSI